MRKATTGMLVAAGLFAVAGMAQAADRAGIGLEWGMGPRISFGTYKMNFGNGASLSWNVGGDFTVGVANSSGQYRAEGSYTNNASPAIGHKVTQTGSLQETSIQVLHSIPGLSFLTVGLELGTVAYGPSAPKYSNSDGSAYVAGQFGTDPGVVPAFQAAEEGILAKVTVLKAESKLVVTTVNINAGIRFVEFGDTNLLGTQQTDSTANPKKAIDQVSSNNNLSLTASVGIAF